MRTYKIKITAEKKREKVADAKQQERRKEISSSRGSKPKPLPFLLLPVLPVLSLSLLLFTLVLQTCTVHQFRMKFIELSCIHFKINSGAPVLVFAYIIFHL